jgi:hypothetical protein
LVGSPNGKLAGTYRRHGKWCANVRHKSKTWSCTAAERGAEEKEEEEEKEKEAAMIETVWNANLADKDTYKGVEGTQIAAPLDRHETALLEEAHRDRPEVLRKHNQTLEKKNEDSSDHFFD